MTQKEYDLMLRELGFLMKVNDYATKNHATARTMKLRKEYKLMMITSDHLLMECVSLLTPKSVIKQTGDMTQYKFSAKEKKEVMAKAKQKGYTK